MLKSTSTWTNVLWPAMNEFELDRTNCTSTTFFGDSALYRDLCLCGDRVFVFAATASQAKLRGHVISVQDDSLE